MVRVYYPIHKYPYNYRAKIYYI